jgi:ribosomal protein S18 acetylase RimI-like enzyme
MDRMMETLNAPDITGLYFRHARGEQDADALHAVHFSRTAHDQLTPLSLSESLPSRERLQEALSRAAAQDHLDRWLVAQMDDLVVGYSQIIGWPEGDGTWVYLTLGWVLPEWRGKGIGTAMLHWTEDRIRRLAAAEHPGDKIELAANASSTETEATALLLHEGYRAVYTVLDMALDASTAVPVHPLPAGVEVRPVLPEHYTLIAAGIHESYQHEYDDGRFNEDYSADINLARLKEPGHDPTLWQVAWDGDQVAGQVVPLVENGAAEIFEVSVRPAWRRRGLARGLLSLALYALRARGIDVIRLRTSNEFRTRAQDLYRSVGFRVVKEFPRYRKPFSIALT